MHMAERELFLTTVFDIASELKVPLLDEKVYDIAIIIESQPTIITFTFDGDESVIRGFLGLAQYYRSIVIKRADKFFIPVPDLLLRLQTK
jgi:hypothetical protein